MPIANASTSALLSLKGSAETLSAHWERLRDRGDDRLVLAVGLAILLHLLPIAILAGSFGIGASGIDSRIGDPDGKPEGVNVEVIDAAEYDRRYVSFTAGKDQSDQQAASKAPAQKPTPPQPASEPEEARPEQASPEQASPEEPQPERTEPAVMPSRPPTPKPSKTTPQSLSETEIAEILESARLDMQNAVQMSSKASVAGLGNASPYVRGVMRKLKFGMPKSNGLKGILVVGIVLSDSGSLAWLGILKTSGKPELDKLVLDGIRATRFEAPPKGASASERKFQVTYEYD